MGGWKLEVFKMGIYMVFPVATFYYFNQPHLYEEWLVKKKMEVFPPEDPEAKRQIQDTVRLMRERERRI